MIAVENLASVTVRQKKYEKAEQYIDDGLMVAKEVGNLRMEARYLCDLARNELHQDRVASAEESATKAYEIADEIENNRVRRISLRLFGTVARKREKYDDAEQYLTESLAIDTLQEFAYLRARTHLERCRLALAQGDTGSAREAVREADEIASELGISHERAHVSHLRGRIAAATDQPADAIKHWQNALEQFEEIGAPQDALRTLRALLESEAGEEEKRSDWLDRATEIFERAPEGVKDQHREWLATQKA